MLKGLQVFKQLELVAFITVGKLKKAKWKGSLHLKNLFQKNVALN